MHLFANTVTYNVNYRLVSYVFWDYGLKQPGFEYSQFREQVSVIMIVLNSCIFVFYDPF